MIDQTFYKKHQDHPGSKGIVQLGDELLLCIRDFNTADYPGMIDLPGGGTKPYETGFDTFKREVSEEFGLEISRHDIVHAKRYLTTDDDGMEGYFVVAKLGISCKDKVHFGDEGSKWFTMTFDEYVSSKKSIPVHVKMVKEYQMSLK